jgi:hypothetical protein
MKATYRNESVAVDRLLRLVSPFSPEALKVLRDWSESGEFALTLEAIHADSDALDQ